MLVDRLVAHLKDQSHSGMITANRRKSNKISMVNCVDLQMWKILMNLNALNHSEGGHNGRLGVDSIKHKFWHTGDENME